MMVGTFQVRSLMLGSEVNNLQNFDEYSRVCLLLLCKMESDLSKAPMQNAAPNKWAYNFFQKERFPAEERTFPVFSQYGIRNPLHSASLIL